MSDNNDDTVSPMMERISSIRKTQLPTTVQEDEVNDRMGCKSPRLVHRNLPFKQSKNTVNVIHNSGWRIYILLQHDWFHVLLRVPTWQSLPVLLTIWTSMILVFAALYVWVDQSHSDLACVIGLEGNPITFGSSFAFSLETTTTVGYALPNFVNSFFDDCPKLQVVVYLQMIWSMMFNAFMFAFFYSRLAKCDSRGNQVVFANKAIVTVVDGQLRFQVRVYDVDSTNPVIEAHIRMYVVTKNRPVPRPLRLIQPNDEFGGMLFLSLPAVASHAIDPYSTLHPPTDTPIPSSGLILRAADSVTCGREEVCCPICGESYGTYERWRSHVKYQRLVEEKENFPVFGTHLSLDKADFEPTTQKRPPPETLILDCKNYFRDALSEVVCVVEAIEPISSGTFAALHSYCFEDIIWHTGAYFCPCVEAVGTRSAKEEGSVRVDMERFHIVLEEGSDAEEGGQLCLRKRKHQASLRVHDSFFQRSSDTNGSRSHAKSSGHHESEKNSGHHESERNSVIQIPDENTSVPE